MNDGKRDGGPGEPGDGSGAEREDESEIVVSVDESGRVPVVVIADISTDEVWVSMPVSEATDLSLWR